MDYTLYGTTIANGRATNMDAIYYQKRKLQDQNIALAVICDGVGSLEYGGYVAHQSVALLGTWFESLTMIDRLGLSLRNAILTANEVLINQCNALGIKSASTLTAILLVEDSYYIVNLGDSRIYGIYPSVICLTQDDTNEHKHITQYIGKSTGFLPQYTEGHLTEQGFLLCSDGLYKRQPLESATLRPKAKTPFSMQRQVQALIAKAVASGEKDNISAIMIGVRT